MPMSSMLQMVQVGMGRTCVTEWSIVLCSGCMSSRSRTREITETHATARTHDHTPDAGVGHGLLTHFGDKGHGLLAELVEALVDRDLVPVGTVGGRRVEQRVVLTFLRRRTEWWGASVR